MAFITKQSVRQGGKIRHKVYKELSFQYFSLHCVFSFTFMTLSVPVLGDHNMKSDDVIFAYNVLPMELSYYNTGLNSLTKPIWKIYSSLTPTEIKCFCLFLKKYVMAVFHFCGICHYFKEVANFWARIINSFQLYKKNQRCVHSCKTNLEMLWKVLVIYVKCVFL